MSIFTKTFLTATLERAVKTAAQSAVGLLGADGLGVLDIDWTSVASVSALAAVVSVLTSVASSAVGGDGPSLTGSEHVTRA